MIGCEKTVDWLRKDAPLLYAQLSDVAVLTKHFGEAAEAVGAKPLIPEARRLMRQAIYVHARKAFSEIGLALEEAEEFARECVRALEPTA